jgi:hypothetical protein
MSTERIVCLVVEPSHGGVFDGAVHAFDLSIGPRMVEFREAMLDGVLGTGQVKAMGPKQSMIREHLPYLANAPAAPRRAELEAVVGQHRVDSIGDALDQGEENPCHPWRRLFVIPQATC